MATNAPEPDPPQPATPAPYTVAVLAWQRRSRRHMTADEAGEFRRDWEALSKKRRTDAVAKGGTVVEMPAAEAEAFGVRWRPAPKLPPPTT